jgi:hypothetical protein
MNQKAVKLEKIALKLVEDLKEMAIWDEVDVSVHQWKNAMDLIDLMEEEPK